MSDEEYTERFWEALAEGEFLVGDCEECAENHFPPAPICPHCHAPAGWAKSVAKGTLYSFSIQRRTAPGFEEPITVGTVELTEGPRVPMWIDADGESLSIGQSVRIVAAEYEGGYDRGAFADYPMFLARPENG